ncbi:hypothetical protein [Actinomycetospora sp. CA-084318]|uniref:hypothetical protein n=1 Tax=Actinomycetospora sp. CA-084318 TaxID=3239892 RepID=UPI003D9722B9
MTAILGNEKALDIPRGPVTATVIVMGQGDEDVVLTAHAIDAGTTVRSPRPTTVQLIDITGHVELGVEPRAGGVFAPGTLLLLTLRGTEGTEVRLPELDVAGRGPRTLVAIDVCDERTLAVAAVNPRGERPLPPLAAAARSEGRARLGVDQTEQTVHLAVLVDLSASMRLALADGRVAAALDVIAGLSHVIGEGRELTAWLGLAEPIAVPASEARLLAGATVEEAARHGSGIGFRAAPRRSLAASPSVTYIVTDGVPADLADLPISGPDTHHLVLTGDGFAAPAGLPASTLPATGGRSAVDHLLTTPGALAELVASMLAAVPIAAHPAVTRTVDGDH